MHAAGWIVQLVLFFLESGENAAAAPRASTGAGGAHPPFHQGEVCRTARLTLDKGKAGECGAVGGQPLVAFVALLSGAVRHGVFDQSWDESTERTWRWGTDYGWPYLDGGHPEARRDNLVFLRPGSPVIQRIYQEMRRGFPCTRDRGWIRRALNPLLGLRALSPHRNREGISFSPKPVGLLLQRDSAMFVRDAGLQSHDGVLLHKQRVKKDERVVGLSGRPRLAAFSFRSS